MLKIVLVIFSLISLYGCTSQEEPIIEQEQTQNNQSDETEISYIALEYKGKRYLSGETIDFGEIYYGVSSEFLIGLHSTESLLNGRLSGNYHFMYSNFLIHTGKDYPEFYITISPFDFEEQTGELFMQFYSKKHTWYLKAKTVELGIPPEQPINYCNAEFKEKWEHIRSNPYLDIKPRGHFEFKLSDGQIFTSRPERVNVGFTSYPIEYALELRQKVIESYNSTGNSNYKEKCERIEKGIVEYYNNSYNIYMRYIIENGEQALVVEPVPYFDNPRPVKHFILEINPFKDEYAGLSLNIHSSEIVGSFNIWIEREKDGYTSQYSHEGKEKKSFIEVEFKNINGLGELTRIEIGKNKTSLLFKFSENGIGQVGFGGYIEAYRVE